MHQQLDGTDLEDVSPFTARRRKELAREVMEELETRGVNVLRELVESPSSCWLTNGYRHSRGRNRARDAVTVQHYELLADRAGGLDDPVEAARRLMVARAEFDAVVSLLMDRVLGVSEQPDDLQTSLELESEEDAEQDVVKMTALADEVLTEEEARAIRDATTEEIASERLLVRALQRAIESGDLPREQDVAS